MYETEDDYEAEEEDWSNVSIDYEAGETTPSVLKCNKTQESPADVPHYKSDHRRTIIHIDIDCFYAQVEMIRNPTLRDKPLGIQQKYLVVTCNYKARELGVTKLMGIKEAKEKCPQLILVSGEDLTHYREMSYKISDFLLKYTPKVERLGFDENFLDVSEMVQQRLDEGDSNSESVGHVFTGNSAASSIGAAVCDCGCHKRLSIGSQIADDIRKALHQELGITCCAGIAHNKLLSKLVAGKHKPNQQTTLFPEQALDLMASQKGARSIPGIGWNTAKKLKVMEVESVLDLQSMCLSSMEEVFGRAQAVTMKQLAFGVDDTPVVPFGLPQTLSDEDSFKKCSTLEDTRCRIKELLHSLLNRLVGDGRIPQVFRLTVRKLTAVNKYTNRESRQCHISPNVFSKFSEGNTEAACTQLEKVAMSLFHKLVDISEPFHLTLINVAFAKLEQKAKTTISSFFTSSKPKTLGSDADSVTEVNKKSELILKNIMKTVSGEKDCRFPSSTEVQKPQGLETWFLKSKEHNSQSSGFSTETVVVNREADVDISSPPSMASTGQRTRTFGASVGAHKSDPILLPSSEQRKRKSLESVASGSFLGKKLKGGHSSAEKKSGKSFVTVTSQQTSVPGEIDHSVLSELPLAIQKEILQGYSQTVYRNEEVEDGLENKEATVENFFVEQKDKQQISVTSKGSASHSEKDSCQSTVLCGMDVGTCENMDENSNISMDSGSMTQKPGQQTTSDRDIQNLPACKIYDTCKSDDVGVIKIGTLDKQNRDLHQVCDHPSQPMARSGITVPPDIDKEVFITLPPDIQSELIQQWKATSPKQAGPSGQGTCKSGNKSSQKTKSPKTTSNILSFFSKSKT